MFVAKRDESREMANGQRDYARGAGFHRRPEVHSCVGIIMRTVAQWG